MRLTNKKEQYEYPAFNAIKILFYGLVILVTFNLILPGCIQARKKTIDGEYYTINKIDSSSNLYLETEEFTGVIFVEKDKVDSSQNSKRFTPTVEDIFKAENTLKQCLKKNKPSNFSLDITSDRIFPISTYYRQYFGYYDRGQKVIFLNCFIKKAVTNDNSWKKMELAIRDGGKGYFSILINITTEKCTYFSVNGIA